MPYSILHLVFDSLVLTGVAVHTAALAPIRKLIAFQTEDGMRIKWFAMLVMVMAFIVGYLGLFFIHWNKSIASDDLGIAGIFFLGAIFVWFCFQLAEKSLALLRIAAVTFETKEAIMITDSNANIIRVNRAFTTITGYTADEVVGKSPRIIKSGKHDQAFYEDLWCELLANGVWSGEIWDRHKDGHLIPTHLNLTAVKNELGEVVQYVAISYDISECKRREEEIHSLAYFDSLTKLPNRRMLMDRLHRAVAAVKRSEQYSALLFLDMDNFKILNDTLGHDYGDLMLQEVANRLRFCTRETDTVARLGGDEFVVLLENLGRDEQAAINITAHLAEKIRAVLAEDYLLKGHAHHSSPSIGVCLHQKQMLAEDLLKYADMAMYQAKSTGRNKVKHYDSAMQMAVASRAALERDMKDALRNNQFQLYYQLQVDQAGRPIGAESLIRWLSPARGMVFPADFISIAEENGLIIDIGEWMLEAACLQLKKWCDHPDTQDLSVAVNISGKQFQLPDFVERVERIIKNHAIDPTLLKLELTESIALGDLDFARAKLLALSHVLQVKLVLDDFGTGYSSLSYLKLLPIQQLKIGQSFVRGMPDHPGDALMVKTIVDMSHNFGMQVIADGVESEVHVSMLKDFGCEQFQGYFYARPLPINEFEALVRNLAPELRTVR